MRGIKGVKLLLAPRNVRTWGVTDVDIDKLSSRRASGVKKQIAKNKFEKSRMRYFALDIFLENILFGK